MQTTNWVEGLTVAALAITAIAAIAAAYFAWLQTREDVLVEAFELIERESGGPLRLTLTVSVCNRRRSSVRPLSLEVRGLPKLDIRAVDGAAKDPRQGPETASFPDMPVPPFETRETRFEIGFDWLAARDAATAANGALRWQALVTFDDRRRYGQRWTQQVDLAFQAADLHSLTTVEAPVVDRRSAKRPFSGAPPRASSL